MFLSSKRSRCLFLPSQIIPGRIPQMPRVAHYKEWNITRHPHFSKQRSPNKDKMTPCIKKNLIGRNWNSTEYQNIPALWLIQWILYHSSCKESRRVTGCPCSKLDVPLNRNIPSPFLWEALEVWGKSLWILINFMGQIQWAK